MNEDSYLDAYYEERYELEEEGPDLEEKLCDNYGEEVENFICWEE